MENNYFFKLLKKRVKVLYRDEDRTHVMKGILREVDPDGKFIVVNDVVIGLGDNFISCIPQREGGI